MIEMVKNVRKSTVTCQCGCGKPLYQKKIQLKTKEIASKKPHFIKKFRSLSETLFHTYFSRSLSQKRGVLTKSLSLLFNSFSRLI